MGSFELYGHDFISCYSSNQKKVETPLLNDVLKVISKNGNASTK